MNPPPTPAPSAARATRARRSLTLQLTLVVAVIVAVLLGALLTAGHRYWREILREQIDARLSAVAESRREMVLAHLSQLKQRAEMMAEHGQFRGLLNNLILGQPDTTNRTYSQGRLNEMADGRKIYSASLADAKGHVLLASKGTEAGGEVAGDPAFENGISGTHIGLPRRVGDHFEVVLSTPVRDYAKPVKIAGVLLMTVDVSPLAHAMGDTTGLGKTGEVLLGVREGGQVRFLFPSRYREKTHMVPLAEAPAMAEATDGRDYLKLSHDYRGELVLAAGRPIGSNGWGLVAKMDEAEAYAPIARALRYALGFGAVVALIGLVAARVLARGFTRPILRLTAAAESVARGNLDVAVPVTSETEVGELTARFNDMTAALRTHTAEREATAEALDAERHRLRTLIDVLPVSIYVKDTASRFLVANAECARSLGVASPEELLGKTDADFFPPAIAAAFLEDERKVMAGDPVVNLEEASVYPDGSARTELTTKVALRDGTGAVTGIVGVSRDITERKRAEEAVRASEALLRLVMDLVPHFIFAKDAEGRFLFVNRALALASGSTPEAMVGRTDGEILSDSTQVAHFRQDDMEVIESGHSKFIPEEPWTDRSGNILILQTSKAPLPIPGAAKPAVLGVSVDITERKRAEVEILRANRRLAFLSEAASGLLGYEDPIVFLPLLFRWLVELLDVEACVYFVQEDNASLRLVLHHGIAEEATAGFRQIAFGEGVCGMAAAERQQITLENVQARSDAMTVITRRLGFDAYTCLPLVARGRLLGTLSFGTASRSRFEEETMALFTSLADEVAMALARQQAEEEIRSLNAGLEQRVRERTAELETANKELEAFSYSVSHDLRAPLRAVNGFVRILQKSHAGQMDAEGNRLLAVVMSEAQRMGRLIDDLLAFSRMGRQHVQRADIDMAALVRAEFELLTKAAPESAPRLDLKPLPLAQGDPAMLRQVFANLLGNAVKFSRNQESPVIEVGASENGETTYYVKDNGVGFDEKYAHKLFGVFQRLHTESEFEGTGVGLALVQRIIHRHGGKVWAEGKPGAGATFYFTLPNPKKSNP